MGLVNCGVWGQLAYRNISITMLRQLIDAEEINIRNKPRSVNQHRSCPLCLWGDVCPGISDPRTQKKVDCNVCVASASGLGNCFNWAGTVPAKKHPSFRQDFKSLFQDKCYSLDCPHSFCWILQADVWVKAMLGRTLHWILWDGWGAVWFPRWVRNSELPCATTDSVLF